MTEIMAAKIQQAASSWDTEWQISTEQHKGKP
jgi:hypothetical protein